MPSVRPIRLRSRSAAGTATIEFAVIAPLLLLLLAGVLDFAMLLRTAACAANAARIGAEWGAREGATSTDSIGMQNAALQSAPGITGLSAAATRSCQCAGSSISCTATCAGGVQVYVQVTVQAPARTIFNYSALQIPGAVTARASMRAQ